MLINLQEKRKNTRDKTQLKNKLNKNRKLIIIPKEKNNSKNS